MFKSKLKIRHQIGFLEKVAIFGIALVFVFQLVFPQYSHAYEAVELPRLPEADSRGPIKVQKYIVTAYSSTPDQTDSTPFITANGTYVYDGIIATNMFPFGTKVRIPEVYGDKVFSVEDRMHERFSDRFDIWMETRAEAVTFGSQWLTFEIY